MLAARSLAALIPALALLTSAMAADAPDLKRDEAEADRLDPGWRFADIQARRAKLPPAKNGAPLVAALVKALPKEWLEIDTGFENRRASPANPAAAQRAWDAVASIVADEPTRPIPPKLLADLSAHRARLDPILSRAPALETYPSGFTPIVPKLNPLEILLPHVQDSRGLVRALAYQGHARAMAGDIDGALASAREVFGVSRSLGDEPFAISQLVRMAFESVAVELIERALARGAASDAALAATQKALADEANEPLLLNAFRGERAVYYDVAGKLASGEIKIPEPEGGVMDDKRAKDAMFSMFRGGQPTLLWRLNQAVAIAMRPLPDQPALIDRWVADIEAGRPAPGTDMRGSLTYMLLPPLAINSQAYMRTRAQLRAAETAVGLERVRLAKRRWPKPGESLVPAFKDGPPADPFTGKPIRWKATPTGLVVYSVGYDRGDHGGNLENRNVKRPGTDIGFRLWDVDRRPAPSKPR